nr:programmed cell death protein 7-like [Lytechinus pictus]
MTSSSWGIPPPPPAEKQDHLYFPPGHHSSHGALANSLQDGYAPAGYANQQSISLEEKTPPFPPSSNQAADTFTNQYRNQNLPSNASCNNSFPPAPLENSNMMAHPNQRVGQGFQLQSRPPQYQSMPPRPPHGSQFWPSGPRLNSAPPCPPPFPVPPPHRHEHHPRSDGRVQPSTNMVRYSPSLPPPPPRMFSHQPQHRWPTDSSPVGPVHGQWNPGQGPTKANFQGESVDNGTQNNFSSHSKQSSGRRLQHGGSNPAQTRLQPYQSFRSKPSERSNQNSFPGKPVIVPGQGGLHATGQGIKTEGDQQEVKESEDQKWVNERSKSLIKRGVSKEATKPMVKISEARMLLTKFKHMLDQLKRKKEEASETLMKENDERKWFQLCKEMDMQMEHLSNLQTRINNPEFIKGLKRQIKRRRRKRDRYRRHRMEEWEMKEEALRVRNEKINASLAAALQAKQEKEQEEVLQKEVDQVLSEVRRKKQDANKTMELFRALRKLRHLRKESAEKKVGYKAPRVLDERFEKKMLFLEEMMNKQKLLYVEEEKALQVMLEEEHEETREKARQKKELKDRKKAEKAWEEQEAVIFGNAEEVELGHPLFMFRQFYQQANHDLQSLINIRRQWDTFIVPESDLAGSRIPLSWVMPSDPSNHIWETAIVDSSGT